MRDASTRAGAAAAVLWLLLCLRWFDVAEPWRPALLAAVPPALLLAALGAAVAVWLRGWWKRPAAAPLGAALPLLGLVLALAFFFRLPVVSGGAGAAVTADGALSGIVALHLRGGSERHVFVPQVPYSGSLKSHLTALVAVALDPARAFALVSVLFYLGYVAGLFRLALLVFGPRAALVAGLYAAFSPAFVTRYSLSNDGNYVEVLALGTWALWLGACWTLEPEARSRLALAAGLLLGLGFWCHILAVIHLAALALVFLLVARAAALRSLLALGTGAAIGYVPGWLWNLANGWQSFRYLLPGEARSGESGEAGVAAVTSGLGEKLWLLLTDHAPVLMGYDTGYGPALDRALLGVSWAAVAAALVAGARAAARALRERSWPLAALLVFAATNLAIALVALPHVPGNPRYILFLMSVIPVFLAGALHDPAGTMAAAAGRAPSRAGSAASRLPVLLLGALIATGAVASLAQLLPTLRQDARWREFVAELEREGVRHCYTDFFIATRINFLSAERIVCSAKLGPFTTEYFFAYRERVERAPAAALIPVNRTAAARLERRLGELGVTFERRDLVKPVLFRLSRKVDPEELFPGREFPMR
jgi:hypothetical protein